MIENIKMCSYCKEKPVCTKNLCTKCYAYNRENGNLERKRQMYESRTINKCKKCKKITDFSVKGKCRTCYLEEFELNKNIIKVHKCNKCGKIEKYYRKGLCTKCYIRLGRTASNNVNMDNILITHCKNCSSPRNGRSFTKGLCRACYEYKRVNGYFKQKKPKNKSSNNK